MISMRITTLLSAALLGASALTAAASLEAQSWRTMTSSRQLWGEKSLDLEIGYGAGTLSISPSTDPLLYQMTVRYDEEHFSPAVEYDRDAGRLRLAIRSRGERGRGAGVNRGSSESRATVALSREVPLALDLKFGAGEAEVELGGMALRSLRVSTGASETELSFSSPNRITAEMIRIEAGVASFLASELGNSRAERFQFEGGVGETTLGFGGTWTRSATATIRMGIGSLRLLLPRDVGIRVVRNSFLTSFDAADLVSRNGAYYSRNWGNTPHQLTINIEAALGSIKVDWID